jgi:NTE family protein
MGRRRASYAAIDHRSRLRRPPAAEVTPRIGLALGGGFARGIAHAGVLRTFERHGIPLHCIPGVSAGSIVAAAFASGARADDISSWARPCDSETSRAGACAGWGFWEASG